MENNNDPPKLADEEDSTLTEKNVQEDTSMSESNKNVDKHRKKLEKDKTFTNIFLLVCVVGVSLGILLEIVIVNYKFQNQDRQRPKYWVYRENLNNKSSILKHVHLVLEREGYELSTNKSPWTLLWSYGYPFKELNLKNLADNQKVNHFPGTYFITSKLDLAVIESKYIPKAFRLPNEKDKFLKYAEKKKDTMFIQKLKTHRGVSLKNVSDIDLDSTKFFVQEYIPNPFLVDGHKFDIGVYVVITSADPLRVYWYKGDVLFRYCLEKYHPFNPNKTSKYVVEAKYLPTWQVPSLRHSFITLGNTMKETFEIYARSKGKDPAIIWEQVLDAIAEVFIKKEHHLIHKLSEFNSKDNFFEMIRFDFIVDENFIVYLLEANMGPNLSSNTFMPNQLLYEQVLYNLFSVTGISQATITPVDAKDAKTTQTMMAAEKNLGVFGDQCMTVCKGNCYAMEVCALCGPCRNDKLTKELLTSYKEHLHRGDFRRILPVSMEPNNDIQSVAESIYQLTPNNRFLHLWYQGKCNQDITWCV